jgi:tetratricopeptide (TPR) repeat protein
LSEQVVKEAFRLYDLAIEDINKSEYADALENFNISLSLMPESETRVRAMVLTNIGLTNVKIKNYDEASKALNESAVLFKNINDLTSQAEQLGNIGSVYRDIENFDEALSYYFEALKIFEQENNINGISVQYSNIGYAYSRKGEYTEALDYFKKAEKLFVELGDARKTDMCQQNIEALEYQLKGGPL